MWVAKLPWVEAVVGCDGKLTMVRCKVYGEIERHEKILVLKFDSLQKHVSRCKCKLHGLVVLWDNTSCQLRANMQKMNACG
jgi:hypothetical protein